MLLYPDAENVKRGPFVDKRIRPDAQFTYGRKLKKRFFVEFDTGKETHRQVRHKWNRNYRGVVRGVQFDALLVVTRSEERKTNLMRWAEKVDGYTVFTTLDAVRADPHGYVWTTRDGKPARIAPLKKTK